MRIFQPLFAFSFCLFVSIQLQAQSDYFQQKVNYNIEVSLDDEKHLLSGKETIVYTNYAPNALDTIYFHLWGNAYKNKETAFAKQQIVNRSTRFYFADAKDLGGYQSIDFLSNGEKLSWGYDSKHIDIAWIVLPKPLENNQSIEFEIPFSLKIPASFSRLGHVGTSYQMTQWYPKPAVYDKNGWHAMPYLDQGEFYSEFGNFDVTISLPKNYVVAASGTLQTAEEQAFLIEKNNATKNLVEAGFDSDLSFPESSSETKTIRYTAENVHDFAWFADKRFHVLKEQVRLNTGKWVDTWAFFTNQEADLWSKGAFYVGRAVEFYSEHVGEYPWPQATAVQSALSAGAGMEYPMITVIGKSGSASSLDRVITHEVGHNWFYGILASNERIHPWQDEGLNSYYENRYMEEFYPGTSELDIPKFLEKTSPMGIVDLAHLMQERTHSDQAPETHSAELKNINYGLDVYMKTAKAMKVLEKYLGTEQFDNLMNYYYENWKFKHPQPEDFEAVIKQADKPTDWFFNDLIYSNKTTNYVLEEMEKIDGGYLLEIENRGETQIPFSISGVKDGKAVYTEWHNGFDDEKDIPFKVGEVDLIAIDYDFTGFDVNYKNNQLKTSGALPAFEPIDAQFGLGLENPRVSRFNWLPALGWNNYDKFMLGLAFYSSPVPSHAFEYNLVPMFGFGSKEFVGIGNLKYQKYFRTGFFERIAVDLDFRRFSFDYREAYDANDYYAKVAPKITFNFRKSSPNSFISQNVSFRSVNIFMDNVRGIDAEQGIFERENTNYAVQELSYKLRNENIISPFLLKTNFQFGEDFTKIFIDWEQSFRFNAKGKKFTYRVFAGWMNENISGFDGPFIPFQLNGITSGTFQRDYMFDEVMLGRSETDGFLSHQIFEQDAGLKTTAVLPSSREWMVGIGLRSGIPNPLPIDPYIDFGIIPQQNFMGETEVKLYYSGGLALTVIPNVIEVYFPILESDNITGSATYIDRPGFSKVSFKFNLKGMNPSNVADSVIPN
ncbi:MAG: M1 family metallopeptidase [Saprospiraceae bacterium]